MSPYAKTNNNVLSKSYIFSLSLKAICMAMVDKFWHLMCIPMQLKSKIFDLSSVIHGQFFVALGA